MSASSSASALLLDAHLHLWDRDRLDYPWMAGRDLSQTSLPADEWEPGVDLHPAAVVVEAGAAAHQWDDEVAWVRGLAADHPHLRGMVAAVDYGAADLRERLDRYAADDFVRGVRDNFEGLPAGALDSPARRAGVLAARDRGLTVDVCIRGDQLPELAALLTAVADKRGDGRGIVLDHVGKPDVTGEAGGASAAWESGIAAIAAIPSVHVKLSGLTGQLPGLAADDDPARLVRDFAAPALAHFGPERAMLGTDHPVSTVPHGVTRGAWTRAIAAELAQEPGAAQILGETAARFYAV